MFWRKSAILFLTTVFMTHARANESAPVAEKAPEKPTTYSGAQTEEWSKAQKDFQTAKIKFENDRKILEDLKTSADLQENLSKESLAKINEATKTMKASEANYLRLLKYYNNRFPEKGLDLGRKYQRQDAEREGIETVEEKPQGVEAKLRRLSRNIKRQYLSGEDANSASGTVKKATQKKQGSGETLENLPQTPPGDVTDTIKIEK